MLIMNVCLYLSVIFNKLLQFVLNMLYASFSNFGKSRASLQFSRLLLINIGHCLSVLQKHRRNLVQKTFARQSLLTTNQFCIPRNIFASDLNDANLPLYPHLVLPSSSTCMFLNRWNLQLLFLCPVDANKYFWYNSDAFSLHGLLFSTPVLKLFNNDCCISHRLL